MKPVLYESTETEFTTKGLGVLGAATSCLVTEERNGEFTLEMNYPVRGSLFGALKSGRIILADASPHSGPQAFRIFKASKVIGGMATFSAQHISYDLSGVVASPFAAVQGASAALSALLGAATTSHNFTSKSTVGTAGSFSLDTPATVRSRLGGVTGSVLDVFGGEYEFDNFVVKLHAHRGQDRGVRIEYGKNLTNLTQEENIASVYTGVYPYWTATDGTVTRLTDTSVAPDAPLVKAAGTYERERIMPLDLTSTLTSEEEGYTPTQAEIYAAAAQYIEDNDIGTPSVSLEVSFVDMAAIGGAGFFARVDLCDTVHVRYSELGVDATAKVVKAVYNVLLDRYEKLELGDARTSIADTIAGLSDSTEQTETDISQSYAAAVKYVNAVSADLQTQVDGKVETWFYAYDPTAENVPASSWSDKEKAEHSGDLFYNTDGKTLWRWTGSAWEAVTDITAISALANAATAQDTADGKRRVFVSKPTPPYDVGDLYTNGTNIYVCKTAKAAGETYASSDWKLASKYQTASAVQTAIDNATKLITGVTGGYVVLHTNASGQPYELLIMDTDDVATATKVWRWNEAGLGYSSTGYDGTYETAITADGQVVADFIATGTLDASLAEIINLNASNITSGTIDASKIAVENLMVIGDPDAYNVYTDTTGVYLRYGTTVLGSFTSSSTLADQIEGYGYITSSGNLTGTINGTAASTVVSNAKYGKSAYNTLSSLYGVSSETAGTVAKTATVGSGFSLAAGAVVHITFEHSNTASEPTLNVNSTGAKPIYVNGAAAASGAWNAYECLTLVYTGKRWDAVGASNLTADNITSGTIDASVITVKNLNASNITSGTIDASKIAVENLNASNITSGTLYASLIKLFGLMTVYQSKTSTTSGGQIGYGEGVDGAGNTTTGVMVKDATGKSYMICTNAGARLTHKGDSKGADAYVGDGYFEIDLWENGTQTGQVYVNNLGGIKTTYSVVVEGDYEAPGAFGHRILADDGGEIKTYIQARELTDDQTMLASWVLQTGQRYNGTLSTRNYITLYRDKTVVYQTLQDAYGVAYAKASGTRTITNTWCVDGILTSSKTAIFTTLPIGLDWNITAVTSPKLYLRKASGGYLTDFSTANSDIVISFSSSNYGYIKIERSDGSEFDATNNSVVNLMLTCTLTATANRS